MLPTASRATPHGLPLEAEASTQGGRMPEDEAATTHEAAATTEEASLAEAGGGIGAAGSRAGCLEDRDDVLHCRRPTAKFELPSLLFALLLFYQKVKPLTSNRLINLSSVIVHNYATVSRKKKP
jgi:hypothetical protein